MSDSSSRCLDNNSRLMRILRESSCLYLSDTEQVLVKITLAWHAWIQHRRASGNLSAMPIFQNLNKWSHLGLFILFWSKINWEQHHDSVREDWLEKNAQNKADRSSCYEVLLLRSIKFNFSSCGCVCKSGIDLIIYTQKCVSVCDLGVR